MERQRARAEARMQTAWCHLWGNLSCMPSTHMHVLGRACLQHYELAHLGCVQLCSQTVAASLQGRHAGEVHDDFRAPGHAAGHNVAVQAINLGGLEDELLHAGGQGEDAWGSSFWGSSTTCVAPCTEGSWHTLFEPTHPSMPASPLQHAWQLMPAERGRAEGSSQGVLRVREAVVGVLVTGSGRSHLENPCTCRCVGLCASGQTAGPASRAS